MYLIFSRSKKTIIPLKKTKILLKKRKIPLKKTIIPLKKRKIPLKKTIIPLKKRKISLEKTIIALKKTKIPLKKRKIALKIIISLKKRKIALKKRKNFFKKTIIPLKKTRIPLKNKVMYLTLKRSSRTKRSLKLQNKILESKKAKLKRKKLKSKLPTLRETKKKKKFKRRRIKWYVLCQRLRQDRSNKLFIRKYNLMMNIPLPWHLAKLKQIHKEVHKHFIKKTISIIKRSDLPKKYHKKALRCCLRNSTIRSKWKLHVINKYNKYIYKYYNDISKYNKKRRVLSGLKRQKSIILADTTKFFDKTEIKKNLIKNKFNLFLSQNKTHIF